MKQTILKLFLLLAITAAGTYKAKAQFDIQLTNNTGCTSISFDVFDNASNILYSGTLVSGVNNFSCVGVLGLPSGIRYSAGGFTTVIIPIATIAHPTNATTGCLVGGSVDHIMYSTATCITPWYIVGTLY